MTELETDLGTFDNETTTADGDEAIGSVGITNDIVFGSTRVKGLLVFMRQSDGVVLKKLQTAGSMLGTPYAVGNNIIWPAGPGNALAVGLVDQHQVLVLSV